MTQEGSNDPAKTLRKTEGYDGPYHLVCTALNLVSGEQLAWQKRQAASFVLSPLFCGFDASQAVPPESKEKATLDGFVSSAVYADAISRERG